MIRHLTAAAMLIVAVPASAEQLPPRADCAGDASFTASRTQLRGIVARRDARALTIVPPNTNAGWASVRLDDRPQRVGRARSGPFAGRLPRAVREGARSVGDDGVRHGRLKSTGRS